MNTTNLNNEQHKERYLTFMLDHDIFGIEIDYVNEIVGIQAVTDIPEMPDAIKGIINLRGTPVPVLNMRHRFQKNSKAYDDTTCVIVSDMETTSLGLIVDRVSEIVLIGQTEIIEPSKLEPLPYREFLKGIVKAGLSNIRIINSDHLLLKDELLEIHRILQAPKNKAQ